MADEVLTEEEPRKPVRPAPTPAAPQPSVSPFRPYKPGQGVHVRWGTAAGTGVIVLAGAAFVRDWMRVPFPDQLVLQTLIPIALVVAAAYLIFWLVGKNRTVVDFMIATEGEMKKVNWSSRKEVFGATKVVIVSVLALGLLLCLVDFVFILLFAAIKVLKIPIWEQFLGATSGQS